jgi:hypothetical protein
MLYFKGGAYVIKRDLKGNFPNPPLKIWDIVNLTRIKLWDFVYWCSSDSTFREGTRHNLIILFITVWSSEFWRDGVTKKLLLKDLFQEQSDWRAGKLFTEADSWVEKRRK